MDNPGAKEGYRGGPRRFDLYHRDTSQTAASRNKKQGVVVDRLIVSAVGVAITAVTEKLAPETARHFERDPTTGEVLWFPGPPIHVSRAPPPCHRLEYLHFLAKKYTQELAGPEPEGTSLVNGNGNGANGARMDVTMEMSAPEPPVKRQKLAPREEEEQRYINASERIKEVLSTVGAA
ncbi:hypothetical protein DFH09DRAFT_1341768 [Mycena vulgaris]|nr:hypothetical protein DFH09DRAFT_1341768 [Mycena vulgaris]